MPSRVSFHYTPLSFPYPFSSHDGGISGTVARGVDGTVASESALIYARILLSQVRAPSPAPWSDGGPESLRSPC
ncbi:hypothetical protein PoB_004784700 [Plakobranchus ocellatus]|uniref:Uncharacterized protein n=1 Tax=Plakobranchus ocellatus TaxID=259542 RepID=A0AAV4BPQ0_9GAST|nr:hypothetical protein PoB_004784700 [Plakobranchus ocellatus]